MTARLLISDGNLLRRTLALAVTTKLLLIVGSFGASILARATTGSHGSPRETVGLAG
jgi:hypothetical protein